MDPAGPERRQARAEREERARTTRSYVPGAVEGLSLLLPGLGHVYTRAAGQGLAWFALCSLSTAGSYTLQATANGMNAGSAGSKKNLKITNINHACSYASHAGSRRNVGNKP